MKLFCIFVAQNTTNIMDTKEIFAKRLKMARQKKGFSMEKLSSITDGAVSKQTISKYEAGKAMAGSIIIQQLANALEVSMDYFFHPFAFDINEIDISFRKKASVGAKDEYKLKSEIQEQVENYLEIEKILFSESTTIPYECFFTIDTKEQIIRLAQKIRDDWGIGYAPIENVKESLIKQGVKVFEIEGPQGFDGVSGIANESSWIVVLNKKVEHTERKRLTALHEYAHLIANNHFSEKLTQKEKEDMCTLFASEMLLPTNVLSNIFRGHRKISWQELISIQCVYGISIDAIMYTLKRIGIISDKRYRSYCIRKNMDPSFKTAVEESRYQEKDTPSVDEKGSFETMVYNALAQEQITEAKAAELLHCSINDVTKNAISF